MRIIFAIAAVALTTSPVLAAEMSTTASASSAVAAKRGAMLRDVKGMRLATIDRVNADGSVQIIFNSRLVTIPADKLVVASTGVATSLTKPEVDNLR
jgi:hypothetical protein